MVSRFSVRLQLLKSLKLYILHGQLLESDAPLAGGLWDALQGLFLLWKALSVSGLLFWPGLGPGMSGEADSHDALRGEAESRHAFQ